MKAFTVNDLLKSCYIQQMKGNGDKKVLLSMDDEGNGYHKLYFMFTDTKDVSPKYIIQTGTESLDEYYNECIILG